jgi:NAD(P)-dependent dehydrogenase (short-subunit alcohol dehydrogenase family)
MSAVLSSQNTAVITGGASGIGLALTKKCVGHGMRVLVADWDEKNLDAVKSALGDKVSTIKVDVSKTEDWTAVKEKVAKDFGGLSPRASCFLWEAIGASWKLDSDFLPNPPLFTLSNNTTISY